MPAEEELPSEEELLKSIEGRLARIDEMLGALADQMDEEAEPSWESSGEPYGREDVTGFGLVSCLLMRETHPGLVFAGIAIGGAIAGVIAGTRWLLARMR
jgi:hypothetical protein